MKTALFILLPILLLMQLAYPCCIGAAIYCDLDFQEYHPVLFIALTVVLMLAACVCLWKIKPVRSRYYNVCCYFLLPFSIINGAIWFCLMPLYILIPIAVNTGSAVFLFYHCTGGWKLLSELISCLLVLNVAVLWGLVMILTPDRPTVRIVEEFPSPDGRYTAQVIVKEWNASETRYPRSDVMLYDHSRDVELFIGKLHLREKRIHYEDADANISVHWLDRTTVCINGIVLDVTKDSYDWRNS